MNVLVTGGCGFVGLNVAEALLAAGDDVVLFDRIGPPAGASAAFRAGGGRFTVIQGDVLDARALGAAVKEHGVQGVIHAAVITAGAEREARDAESILRVNVGGAVNAMRAAKDGKCTRFVYVSSGAAYGKTHDEGKLLQEEASPSRPADLYGLSKFTAEQAGARLADVWGLDVVSVRLGTVFGPWEFDTGVRDMLSPYLTTARMAARGEAAVVPPKEPWRDWVYSRDVAAGFVRVLKASALRHRLYHLSSGMDWRGGFARWCDLLRAAYPRFSWRHAKEGEQANVSFIVDRDRSAMDIGRITVDAGFRPAFGPDAAYRDYVAWLGVDGRNA